MINKIRGYIQSKSKILKKNITAIYYAHKNPRLPLLARLSIFLTLGYALSPIDLIPDFIPILGYLDDLLILPFLIALSIKLIPKKIMIQSRKDAEAKPIKLKDNWVFALIFIIFWIILLYFIITYLIKYFIK